MSRPTVLIVDDEPHLIELLIDWLEEDGYEVRSATDGVEDLNLFFDHQSALPFLLIDTAPGHPNAADGAWV